MTSEKMVQSQSGVAAHASVLRTWWEFLFALSDVTRRCLLPVTAASLIGVLLALPQTGEFLEALLLICGTDEARCGLTYGVRATALQFIVFELLSLVFALTIWYLARILVSYRNGHERNSNRFTKQIEIWIPRLAGAVPFYAISTILLESSRSTASIASIELVLVVIALLLLSPVFLHFRFSSIFGRKKLAIGFAASSIGVVLCSIQPTIGMDGWAFTVPWLGIFVCYAIFAWQFAVRSWLRGLAIVVMEFLTGLATVEIGLVARSATIAQTWVWTVPVTMMLPALYLVFVIFRRNAGLHRKGKRWYRNINRALTFKRLATRLAPRLPWRSLVTVLSTSMLVVLLCIVAALVPEQAAKLLFAPAAVILWLIAGVLITFLFFFAIPLVLRFMAIAGFIAITLISNVPPLLLRQPEVALNSDLCNDRAGICLPGAIVQKQYDSWQALHGGSNDQEPIIVIASAGGGTRAAAHTATMLAAVDAATCGVFGDRVFAISAVSGGALGTATYIASRRDAPWTKELREQCWERKVPQERYARLLQPLVNLNSADYLSPMMIRLLFRDIPLSLLPTWLRSEDAGWDDFRSRAGILMQSWKREYRKLLENEPHIGPIVDTFSNTRAKRAGEVDGTEPLVLFNSTSVQDGRRVVMSQPLLCPNDGYCAVFGQSLLSDAIDSARFPYISPPRTRDVYGWNAWSKSYMVTQQSLVDGGYSDNSGIVTLLDVIDGLLDHHVAADRIKAYVITSNPAEGRPVLQVLNDADPGLLAQLQAPLKAMVNSREGRTDWAMEQLRRRLKPSNLIYWPMTEDTLNAVDDTYKAQMERPPEVLALEHLHGVAPTELRLLHEPPLAWALSQDSANRISIFAQSRFRAYGHPENDFIYPYEREMIHRLNLDSSGAAVVPTP
ncbi:hypothetical protein [Rugamonas sp.]|uniref:hypothetical protein n=1 Tax=Rugamonas sp. TaxID=1926287 RepID=UPI0025E3D2D3|nr:hypothetical protein [Rugamonas sp.]